ncbi:hypothetical protein [Flavisolibacter tropicus]|uniref:hypothetical protein n=1 Tax=Flavisolibacter tropicus TaxID=1492898 RepID=UPI000832F614|nr:hypothetical protein [Flavisolibacter tropicus]
MKRAALLFLVAHNSFGNLLIGGVLGMLIIDPATGAMWRLETPPINVRLQKSNTTVMEPALKIINIKDIPQDMKTQLVRVK